jgi:ABC-type sugar transport system permease subunit
LIISFVFAIMLNQKFKGRAFARTVFFLPVIITSGILLRFDENTMRLITKDINPAMVEEAGFVFSARLFDYLKYDIGLNPSFVSIITGAIGRIYALISRSGVQILIYLAAMQGIDPFLREASNIDGATGWEYFWKVTLPMVSPYVLVCFLYTAIDSFTDPTNVLMVYLNRKMFMEADFSNSSAMAWIYFVIIISFIAMVSFIASKVVYYED